MQDREELRGQIKGRYIDLAGVLHERALRLWCASEAKAIGRGGIVLVHEATGISKPTITKGLKELAEGSPDLGKRVRRKGGGRHEVTKREPLLLEALNGLIEPATRGDPESPLRWTSKSAAKLAEELNSQGFKVAPRTVYRLLVAQKYSLKSNRKRKEGTKGNPDRDAQFRFINERTKEFQARRSPVLSVDTKKKENIGEFKNNGREWSKKGEHTDVKTHDFVDKAKGKAAPYGVYDVTDDSGWVSVGISADTAEFAVNGIRSWYYAMGEESYKDAPDVMVTADCGGSNGNRVRLWKYELQKLANELGKAIAVSHFPPGTSKWNKIEHRMFSHISLNWRAVPLVDLKTVVELIGNTTTKTGLKIKTQVDERTYEKGRKISDEEFKKINIVPNEFHGEWNYTILPQK